MVTLMQCIHDTVYTLEHPCYATHSLSQFLQSKKRKKNVFIGSKILSIFSFFYILYILSHI